MISTTHMVERHILEYEARLHHMDELAEHADTNSAGGVRMEASVQGATAHGVSRKSAEDFLEDELAKAGPMGAWDAVAQQVEKWVERAGG